MAVEILGKGETVTVQSTRGVVTVRAPSYSVSVMSGIIVGGVPYEGAYEITPDADGEVVPTRTKTMREDLTVRPIPVATASNEAGGYTVSIAS